MGIKNIIYKFIPNCALNEYRFKREMCAWKRRNFSAPSPAKIKRAILLREELPNTTWVETGTYLGETTALLGKKSQHVHTIEVEPNLAKRAKNLFSNNPKITVWEGDSAEVFPKILPQLSGNINLWLDGHYSGGITGTGEKETPIIAELETLTAFIKSKDQIHCKILVDDVRCFGEDPAYPELNFLCEWAKLNKAKWHIEHDIFIAEVLK